jgi:hypothetical protein
MSWLERLLGRRGTGETPGSMTDLRRGDPCWCGSGRKYGSCHRQEDRQRRRELGIDKKGACDNPFV